jgi:hypothetical protein
MMSLQDRLAKVLQYSGLSANKMSALIGLTHGYFGKIVAGNYKPNSEILERILQEYPDIDGNWLLTGKGQMLISSQSAISEASSNAPFDAPFTAHFDQNVKTKSIYFAEEAVPYGSQPGTPRPYNKSETAGKVVVTPTQTAPTPLGLTTVTLYQQPQIVTEDTAGRPNIALVNTPAMAGYPTHIADIEYFTKLPKFSLPFAALRNGTYRAFTVRGLSMYDTLFDGDVVLTEFQDNWPDQIRDGLIYVIATHNQVFIKRVNNRARKSGYLILQSDNFEETPTFTLNVEEVVEVWKVVFNITPQLPNRNKGLLTRLADIEARLHHVETNKPSLNTTNDD